MQKGRSFWLIFVCVYWVLCSGFIVEGDAEVEHTETEPYSVEFAVEKRWNELANDIYSEDGCNIAYYPTYDPIKHQPAPKNELWECMNRHAFSLADGEIRIHAIKNDLQYVKCIWFVEGVNRVFVQQMETNNNVKVMLTALDGEENNFRVGRNDREKLDLNFIEPNDVILIENEAFQIIFELTPNQEDDVTIVLSLYHCQKGFSIRDSLCLCEENHYITRSGECVPCLPGSVQNFINQNECHFIQVSATYEPFDSSGILPSGSVELTNSPYSLVHASACTIESHIFVVGGRNSLLQSDGESLMPMNLVMRANSLVGSVWSRLTFRGDIPSRRTNACFIGHGGLGYLVGGESESPDPYMYVLSPRDFSWTRAAHSPRNFRQIGCTNHENWIFVYDGANESTGSHPELWRFQINEGSWLVVVSASTGPYVTHPHLVFWRDSLYILGGREDYIDVDRIFQYELHTNSWSPRDIDFHPKWLLSDEAHSTKISIRAYFAFGLYGDEVHIFGGRQREDAFEDMIILSLDKMSVVHRETYWLTAPTLPLTYPPPKYGSAFVFGGRHLMIVGGANQNRIVGNDVWIWDMENRRWADSSIARYPIHRYDSSLVRVSQSSFAIFGGVTSYLEDVRLNDMWLFRLDSQSWENLYRGSHQDGPKPRNGAILSFYEDNLVVCGGQTDLDVFDAGVWLFDLDSKEWVSLDIVNKLHEKHRPFNRVGMSYSQISNRVYMWGGQLAAGLKMIGFYVSVIVLDLEEMVLSASEVVDNAPIKRKHHSMCNWQNGTLSVHGGLDFYGSALNDHWSYQTDTNEWVPLGGAATSKYSTTHGTCSDAGHFMVISGRNPSTQTSELLLINKEPGTISQAFVDTNASGLKHLWQSAALTHGDVVLFFGGTDRSRTTNQIFAYKIGMCSQTEKTVVYSTFNTTAFDDGSGDGFYMENTNCTWILPTATHMIINHNMRDSDSIIVRAIEKDDAGDLLYFGNGKGGDKILISVRGFTVHFYTDTKADDPDALKPCVGCEGFRILHASCPENAHMDMETQSCECDSYYHMSERTCIPDKDTLSSTIVSLLGTAIRAVFMFFPGSHFIRRNGPQIITATITTTTITRSIVSRHQIYGPCSRLYLRRTH